jgi:hypothetical protein
VPARDALLPADREADEDNERDGELVGEAFGEGLTLGLTEIVVETHRVGEGVDDTLGEKECREVPVPPPRGVSDTVGLGEGEPGGREIVINGEALSLEVKERPGEYETEGEGEALVLQLLVAWLESDAVEVWLPMLLSVGVRGALGEDPLLGLFAGVHVALLQRVRVCVALTLEHKEGNGEEVLVAAFDPVETPVAEAECVAEGDRFGEMEPAGEAEEERVAAGDLEEVPERGGEGEAEGVLQAVVVKLGVGVTATEDVCVGERDRVGETLGELQGDADLDTLGEGVAEGWVLLLPCEE